MAAVTEEIVREYFETLGYLVNQPRKYTLPGKPKSAEEGIDFLIRNPQISRQSIPDGDLLWTTEDLSGIASAVVGVVGWHTDRFYAKTFEQDPELLRFTRPGCIKYAERILGSKDVAKILCLPRLPASPDLCDKTLAVLRKRGVNGIITFERMLIELIFRTEVKRNYEKSDVRQAIRLLKIYGLLSNDQLELFTQKRRRKRG
jgi:hypothetical protein